MISTSRALLAAALVAGASIALPAAAQNSMGSGYNWKPYSGGGYVGLSVGRSDYGLGCGNDTTLYCDNTRTAASIYTGSWLSPHLGLELGYMDLGHAERAGGETRARGINLAVVGRLPLASGFNVLGKLGTTYGRTETSSVASSGVPSGDENGWGLSYGVGVSYDITPQWALTLDWQRNRFHFVEGRDDVDTTSLGVRYNF